MTRGGGGQNVLDGGASDGGDGHDACGGDCDGGIVAVPREHPPLRRQSWMWCLVVVDSVVVGAGTGPRWWLRRR